MKILIIDDSPKIRRSLTRILERNGHHVSTEESGAIVMQPMMDKFAEFDLILTDYDMPVLNGIGVIWQVKKQAPLARIWLMSGNMHDYVAANAIQIGAEKALDKSKILDELRLAGFID